MTAYFTHITGNDHIKSYLLRMVEKKAIANSLLFAGADGIGKSLFAEAFAKLLLCQDDPQGKHLRKIESGSHPDIRIYHPEGKIGMHSIDSMRQFSEEVYLSPYEAQSKVFIIHAADRMLSYSANALLKTFEEPALTSIIILLSSSPKSLLPTVLSRCRAVYFHTLPEDSITTFVQKRWGKDDGEARTIAALAQGSIGNAFRLVEQGSNSIRLAILQMLAKGKLSSYKQLIDGITDIGNQIEQEKQLLEECIRVDLLKAYSDTITSAQQQGVDKEVDGAIAMRLANDAHAIFDVILSWYRDMHLLDVKGNTAFLFHHDFRQHCDSALRRGEIIPLEVVQKAIAQARLSLERSIPINSSLETLFLQLNFL